MDINETSLVATAAFTAMAALASLATVLRIEADRRRERRPDFHVELLHDRRAEANEVRLTVTNEGGPAVDVQILGVDEQFGLYGVLPPTGYWRRGEQRVFTVSMPVRSTPAEIEAMVVARDPGRRSLFAATLGGRHYRWTIARRPWRKASNAWVWHRVFGDSLGPLDVAHTPMDIQVQARTT